MKKRAMKSTKKNTEEYVVNDANLNTDIVFTSYPEGIELNYEYTLSDYIQKVTQWHHDRNLIKGSTDKDQTLKLLQELGELSDSVCKGKDVSDDLGDMMVVIINIAERNGLTLQACLEKAWNDIKHRKGKMVDGIFVKESDL